MEKLRILRERLARLGAQRWSKEALLAVLLTLAAAAFIATALVGRDASVQGKTPYEAAHKPPQ